MRLKLKTKQLRIKDKGWTAGKARNFKCLYFITFYLFFIVFALRMEIEKVSQRGNG